MTVTKRSSGRPSNARKRLGTALIDDIEAKRANQNAKLVAIARRGASASKNRIENRCER
jgi:hypothetical protein